MACRKNIISSFYFFSSPIFTFSQNARTKQNQRRRFQRYFYRYLSEILYLSGIRGQHGPPNFRPAGPKVSADSATWIPPDRRSRSIRTVSKDVTDGSKGQCGQCRGWIVRIILVIITWFRLNNELWIARTVQTGIQKRFKTCCHKGKGFTF